MLFRWDEKANGWTEATKVGETKGKGILGRRRASPWINRSKQHGRRRWISDSSPVEVSLVCDGVIILFLFNFGERSFEGTINCCHRLITPLATAYNALPHITVRFCHHPERKEDRKQHGYPALPHCSDDKIGPDQIGIPGRSQVDTSSKAEVMED